MSLKINKTDANDAHGLAQIMRAGWYREVAVKSDACQIVRALLVARAQLVSQITTLKNCVRGILKTAGLVMPKGLRSQFPARVRQAVDGHPALAAIVEPALRVLEATRAQLSVYDRAVMHRARGDGTVRRLMSAPGAGAVVALTYVSAVADALMELALQFESAHFAQIRRHHQSVAREAGGDPQPGPSSKRRRSKNA